MLRMHGRWLAIVAVGWFASGCAAKPKSTGPQPETRAAAPVDAELVAVAAAVDPGPQKPMIAALTPALRAQIVAGLGATAATRVASPEIAAALGEWNELSTRIVSGEEAVATLVKIGRALVLAEHAAAVDDGDPELLLALTQIYSILDNPTFSLPEGTFQRVLQLVAQMSQTIAPALTPADRQALTDALTQMFARAGSLCRHTSATFLRRHGDHPQVPVVLGRLAQDLERREDFGRAVQLRQMAMRRLGDQAGGSDHIDLARACYRAHDLACGDAAVQRARTLDATGTANAKAMYMRHLAAVVTDGEHALRLKQISADVEIERVLERGHLLLLLGHLGDARALYEQLRTTNPQDARPYAGLAKLEIHRSGDFLRAVEEVARGKLLKNQDRDYYEVALGTLAMKLLYQSLPMSMQNGGTFETLVLPLLADMRRYADGLRPHDPARMGVVDVLESSFTAAAPALFAGDLKGTFPVLRGMLTRSEALPARFPASADAWRMVYLAANFAADAKRALAAVRAPLPGALVKDVALQRARAQTWLGLTLSWEAEAELAGLAQAIAEIPEQAGDRTRTMMHAAMLALRFVRTRTPADAEQARAIYQAAANDGPVAARVVALNNLGVMRVELGELTEATQHFIDALTLDPGAMPALLNLAATVLRVRGTQQEDLLEAFATVARGSKSAALRLQAHAWRVAQVQTSGGDVAAARAEFTAALANERASETRGSTPLGSWGLIVIGTVEVKFSYSVPTGFEILNEVDMTPWLIVRAPGLAELVAAAERVKKPAAKRSRP